MLETQTISFNFFYVDKIIGAIGSIESYEGWRARQQPPPSKPSSAAAVLAPATSSSSTPPPAHALATSSSSTPPPAHAADPRSSAPLSPAAHPFYPRGRAPATEVSPALLSDDDYDDLDQVDYSFTPSPSPSSRPSYCEVARRSPIPVPHVGTSVPALQRPQVAEAATDGQPPQPADRRPRRGRPSRRARLRRRPLPATAAQHHLPGAPRRRISPELAARLGPIPPLQQAIPRRRISPELAARLGPIPPPP